MIESNEKEIKQRSIDNKMRRFLKGKSKRFIANQLKAQQNGKKLADVDYMKILKEELDKRVK